MVPHGWSQFPFRTSPFPTPITCLRSIAAPFPYKTASALFAINRPLQTGFSSEQTVARADEYIGMSFRFDWSILGSHPLDPSMLSSIISKARKPPSIVGDLVVKDFALGNVSPQVDLLDINEVCDDSFSATFQFSYSGDARFQLAAAAEINSLALYTTHCPRWAQPGSILGNSALQIPVVINITDLKIKTRVLLKYCKSKGVVLIVLDDPLESLSISSNLDSIASVKQHLHKELHTQIRDAIIEDLPPQIFKKTSSNTDPISHSRFCDLATAYDYSHLLAPLGYLRSAWTRIKMALSSIYDTAVKLAALEDRYMTLNVLSLDDDGSYYSRSMLHMSASEIEKPGKGFSSSEKERIAKPAKGPRRIIKLGTRIPETRSAKQDDLERVQSQSSERSTSRNQKSSFSLPHTPQPTEMVPSADNYTHYNSFSLGSLGTHSSKSEPQTPPDSPLKTWEPVVVLSPKPQRLMRLDKLDQLAGVGFEAEPEWLHFESQRERWQQSTQKQYFITDDRHNLSHNLSHY